MELRENNMGLIGRIMNQNLPREELLIKLPNLPETLVG
jgi:hypothetical protein